MNLTPLKIRSTGRIISFNEVDLYVIDPGIVVSEFKPETQLNMDLALQILEATERLTDGAQLPHLFIPGSGQQSDIEVNKWGATEEANKYTTAIAIISRSLPHRIGGNFYLSISKPVRPAKLFKEVDNAIHWLTEYI